MLTSFLSRDEKFNVCNLISRIGELAWTLISDEQCSQSSASLPSSSGPRTGCEEIFFKSVLVKTCLFSREELEY